MSSSSTSQENQILTLSPLLTLLNHNAEITNESKCQLQSLLAKESSASASANAGKHCLTELIEQSPFFAISRSQAVDWMLKVHDFYSFSAHTVILAVNYFDRFFARFEFPEGSSSKPWMIHLVAVACLTLAAKMEETYVPLLVDFQVDDAKYVFEAKTIQKTEILILSTLDWEMNAATPISFIEHFVIVFGFTINECFSMCEDLLLQALADVGFVKFPSSVIAASAILTVISTLEPFTVHSSIVKQIFDTNEYHIDKSELDECCIFLQHSWSKYHRKRDHKLGFSAVQDSPNGVLDGFFNSSEDDDGSNDSWVLSSSSSAEPVLKRTKFHHTHENQECLNN